MYCQHCGAETIPGLKYCKRCGANLAPSQDAVTPQKFPMTLTLSFLAVIATIAITGLVAPFATFSETTTRGGSTKELAPLLFVTPFITFAIVGLLIWLMLRLIKMYQLPGGATETRHEVKQSTAPQMAAPPDMVASVTEHTTRNFEPVENLLQRHDPKEKVTR